MVWRSAVSIRPTGPAPTTCTLSDSGSQSSVATSVSAFIPTSSCQGHRTSRGQYVTPSRGASRALIAPGGEDPPTSGDAPELVCATLLEGESRAGDEILDGLR